MTSLSQSLSDIVGQAFEVIGVGAELGAVRVSDRPDLAQFQCNGAMAAAKTLKKNPREIAQSIVDELAQQEVFSKVEIAGPGFINLDVTDAFLKEHLETQSKDNRFGVPTLGVGQIILDYGGMNVAKAMHVGHLRPNVIGDCLRSLLRFAGYDALGDVHLGDWGLQMGQIISEFEIRYPEWPYFDPDYKGNYPPEPLFTYKDLEKIYPEASQACKDDEGRLEKAREATAKLQDGHAGYTAIWQHFIDLSLEDIRDNLAPLNIDYDIWKGEACVHPLIAEIGKDLLERNIAEVNDGATIIRVAQGDDKHDIPPLMFYKSDGAVTYGTTDIATIYDRTKLYPDLKKMIYVVDYRQSLHFEQVFRSCDKAGYTDTVETIHIGNGTVNGPDGKPFKTREGKAMTFRDLVNTVIEKAATRLDEADLAQDMGEEERSEIARKVGVSALKFTELSNQPHMDYIFDIDCMTAFEGKTGPYLLYQSVRIQSLLRKAADKGLAPSEDLKIQENDQELALLLGEFASAVELSVRQLSPHVLCDYAFNLAQAFSSFYAACHIMSEEDAALQASRLRLCVMTNDVLVKILDILGIQVPTRM